MSGGDRTPEDRVIDLAALDPTGELARVRAAALEVEQAYAQARSLVFDAYPAGEWAHADLNEEQRAAVDALRKAEAELDAARRRMHGAKGTRG